VNKQQHNILFKIDKHHIDEIQGSNKERRNCNVLT